MQTEFFSPLQPLNLYSPEEHFEQTVQTELLDIIKQDVSSSTLSYDIVESLTTEVGARMVGTPGADAATDWAVAKNEGTGL